MSHQNSCLKRLFPARAGALVVGLLILAAPTAAQDPSINTSMLGHWDGDGDSYADVWVQGNYAYVAHYHQARINILNISNPASPQLVKTYNIPAPNNGTSAQDIKVANDLCFIGLEYDGNDGVQVLDVRNPANPRFLANIRIPGFTDVHNLYYDATTRYLYLANARDLWLAIVDLTNLFANSAPPGQITQAKWVVQLAQGLNAQAGPKDRLQTSPWSGTATCAVTGKRLSITADTPYATVNGAPVFVDSAESLEKLMDEPEKYITWEVACPATGLKILPKPEYREFLPKDGKLKHAFNYYCCGGCSGNRDAAFVHDITVKDGKMYASCWGAGFWVYDVSNIANQPPVTLAQAPGQNCHSNWPTADGKYLVTAEERAGGGIKLYEVLTGDGGYALQWRDFFALGRETAFTVHNPIVIGDTIYCAWYQSGLQAFDLTRGAVASFGRVAAYDTSTYDDEGGYAGAWGVHPINASLVAISDMQSGLWLLDPAPAVLRMKTLTDAPTWLTPGQMATFDVEILDHKQTYVAGSATLYYRLAGGTWRSAPLASLGDHAYRATLPGLSAGKQVGKAEFYIAATGNAGGQVCLPVDGAAAPFQAPLAFSQAVFTDDFETDQGWVVSNGPGLTQGMWERGDPFYVDRQGLAAQPEDDASVVGTQCFITQIGAAGDWANINDVDGGATTLVSPLLNFSAGNGRISYAYWFFNDDFEDPFEVYVSNNGGATWTLVNRQIGGSGRWRPAHFDVGDYVTPTGTVRVKFVVEDLLASITEAGIDDFKAEVFTARPVLVTPAP